MDGINTERRKNSIIKSACFLLAFICLYIFSMNVQAAKNEEGVRKIRVAFPSQKGFTYVEQNGSYSGYTYEYLQEIAQYAGWEYEFVQMDGDTNEVLVTMLQMLEEGELDLIGAMNRSEELEQIYDYPSYSYGSVNYVLCTLNSNTNITTNSLAAKKKVRVAVLKTAEKRNKELKNYFLANDIKAEYVECESIQDQIQALRTEKADVMTETDTNLDEEFRIVAKFASVPFYFATTKGNAEIVNKLNSAIIRISEVDPYFSTDLHEKYFTDTSRKLVLSEEEKQYIAEAGNLAVGILTGKPPIQYADPETERMRGISISVLDFVSEKTGLAFEYKRFDTIDELNQAQKDGEIQIIAGVQYDYETAQQNNLALTRPYLSSQMMKAVHKKFGDTELIGQKLALSMEADHSGQYEGDVVRYETVEDCVQAVKSGEAGYTYLNGYTSQYLASQGVMSDLLLIPQTGWNSRICLAVDKPADINLISIIDKTVYSISESEMQSIIYANIVSVPQNITLWRLIKENAAASILAIVSVAVLIIGGLAMAVWSKQKYSKRIAFENARYEQLSELSNEFFYEYDNQKDCLLLTEKMADYFGSKTKIENFVKGLSAEGRSEERLGIDFIQIMRGDFEGTRDLCAVMPDGGRRWLRVTVKQIRDKNGLMLRIIGKVQDIDEERREKELLVMRAQKDSLTNVYNAATVRSLVGQFLRKGELGTFFIMDVDYFKNINDQYGHLTGDHVLTQMGELLKGQFRSSDVVGRLGGDEFVVFMRGDMQKWEIAQKCESMLQNAADIAFDGKKTEVTLSIGAATAGYEENYNDLYRRADRMLYKVKKSGRNGYRIDLGKEKEYESDL